MNDQTTTPQEPNTSVKKNQGGAVKMNSFKPIKSFKWLSLIFIALLFSSCATIPQESVDLSSEVGSGLKKQHQTQIELINLHFSIKRQRLDAAMEKAVNSYFESLTPSGTIELSKSQLKDVTDDVIFFNTRNNDAKEELEKTRLLLIKKLNENYLALNLANSSLTGLLQSAVTVKQAHSEAFQSLSRATEGKIDLDQVFAELDRFIIKGGEEAGKTIQLTDKIKTLLENINDEKDKKDE